MATTTITEHKRKELAIHGYTMDDETACKLHRLAGILILVRNSMADLGINDPVPDGVDDGLWALQDILDSIMVRGGIKAVRS